MNWLINGKTPEELDVVVAGWTEQTLNASELVLNTVVDNHIADLPAELAFNSTVVVTLDGAQVYKGTVRQTPRSAAGLDESVSYKIMDAMDAMDRVGYVQERSYADSIESSENTKVTHFSPKRTGAVIFGERDADGNLGADAVLGARVRMVVEYAASIGIDVAVGDIADGIIYVPVEYKDQTCGELIRDMMRLMPEYTFYIDNRQSTPTANLVLRSELESRTYDITGGEVVDHQVTELESEVVRGVVVQYEVPISVDGDNVTFLKQDVAGESEGLDVVRETVAIGPGNYTNEYQRIVTAPIVQEDDTEEAQLAWWLKWHQDLAPIVDQYGESTVSALLKLADSNDAVNAIMQHTVKVLVDDVERPDPINQNGDAIDVPGNEQDEDPEHYPRMLIEGALPEWSTSRFRKVRVSATVGISDSDLESISNEGLKASLSEIFNLPKVVASGDYQTATFHAVVDGTNAISKNYSRQTTADLNEPVPEGLAEQLFEQFSQVRRTGSMKIITDEMDVESGVWNTVNFTNGRAGWESMNEVVQSVEYNVDEEATYVTFGPAEQLSANDLTERLRAARINKYSHGLRSDRKITEGVGGVVMTPAPKFTRIGGGGGGGSFSCPLGDMLVDSDNSTADSPRYKIRPGSCHLYGYSFYLEKDNINPSAGDKLYLKANVTVDTEDGEIFSSGVLNSAELVILTAAPEITEEDALIPENPTGDFYRELGRWVDAGNNTDGSAKSPEWNQEGCGPIELKICSVNYKANITATRSSVLPTYTVSDE